MGVPPKGTRQLQVEDVPKKMGASQQKGPKSNLPLEKGHDRNYNSVKMLDIIQITSNYKLQNALQQK